MTAQTCHQMLQETLMLVPDCDLSAGASEHPYAPHSSDAVIKK